MSEFWRDPATGFVRYVTEHRIDSETGRRQYRTRLMGDYGPGAWSRWIDDTEGKST